MNFLDWIKIGFVALSLCAGSISRAHHENLRNKTQLFQRLSDAGIDQIIELPYNPSLIGAMAGQVRVHNIVEMQDHPNRLPEPTGLVQEYNASNEYYTQRQVLPQLSYRTGDGECQYKEAVKVNDILVCYKSAMHRHIRINTGPRCTTVESRLSYCVVFAHNVDDVVRAISSID